VARPFVAGDPRRGGVRTGRGRTRLPSRRAQRQPLLRRRPRSARRLELGVAREPGARRRCLAAERATDAGPLAAFVAGVWAAVAGLPPPETAPSVRAVQRAQLAVALDWIDRDLL
jgi:hypothetical protein